MSSLGRRVAAAGSGFVDTFLRDNKVIPVVLALLALLVFAWVAAGLFLSGSEDEPVSNRANFAQSENTGGSNPSAPEAENRDVNSYAAYQSKDPFRRILAPAETTTATTPETTAEETTGGERTSAGGGGGPTDSDGDGLSNRKEEDLGLNPNNPDTDGDGIEDSEDIPAAGPRGGGRENTGANRGGGLFNSGGNLPVP